MSLNYKLVTLDDDQFLTVYRSGEAPLLASSDTHTNFDELVALAQAGDESVVDMFDLGKAIQKAFEDVVSGRVAVRNGQVYFDDDLMDNAITEAILRVHGEGLPFTNLVKFMENVMANPQAESREQFYRYLEQYELPIDADGCVVLYKGVYDQYDGSYASTHAGHAFVNGKEYSNVRIPNRVGDVVTMPRSEVAYDPNAACASGLHSGTHSYARTYGDTLMYIRVNPRDVVSVPHDVSSQKVRVCRYDVIGFADKGKPYEGAYWKDEVTAVGGDEDFDLDDFDDFDLDDFYGLDVEDDVDEALDSAAAVEPKVGDRVEFKTGRLGDREVCNLYQGLSTLIGKKGTVTDVCATYGGITKDYVVVAVDGLNYAQAALWFEEVSVIADDKPAGVRDTRENHKFQKRGPGGRFLPKDTSKTV